MTTQPHPEPSEEASSLPVVAWFYSDGKSLRHWLTDDETEAKHYDSASVPLTPQDDAQSQLTALRAERDIARDERAALWDELATLKAAPVVDVEARAESLRDSLRLDWLERHAVGIENSGRWWSVFGDDTGAAETLRKAVDRAAGLASPEGSPR